MTVLTSVPKITAVLFKGLDNLVLPFTSHVIDPGVLDTGDTYAKAQADNDDKYFVKSVTGLEPPPRNVAIASTAGWGNFQGVTSEDREVVALIGLNPDWDKGETPGLLRANLETMLYTGYDPRVDIQLFSGIFPICHEFGYVSNFEASIFDANPAVQITFTMLNPTFRAFTPISYAKEDLSETNPDIYNTGTAETGFQFGVKFTDDMNGWYIKQTENQSIGMTFDHAFNDGDILTVSTIPGQKYVHLKKHRGKVKNMLSILTTDSEWIQLHPGHNHFVVPKKLAKWDWKGPLSFTSRYAGI